MKAYRDGQDEINENLKLTSKTSTISLFTFVPPVVATVVYNIINYVTNTKPQRLNKHLLY